MKTMLKYSYNLGDEFMKKILSILFLLGISVTTLSLSDLSFAGTAPATVQKHAVATEASQPAVTVKPLDLVANPSQYMRKRVVMTSKFAKFSTLGLDYKRAMRCSDEYISFLFLREDAVNNIPLSELKMFLKRNIAEKLPDIDEGDTVKVTGTVFSNALGDAWVDAESITVVNKVKKDDSKK